MINPAIIPPAAVDGALAAAEVIHPVKFDQHYAQNDYDGDCLLSDVFLKDYKPKNDVVLLIATAPCAFEDVHKFMQLTEESQTKGFDIGLINYSTRIDEVRAYFDDSELTHFFAADSHTKTMQELANEVPAHVLNHGVYIDAPNFDITWRSKKLNWWSGTTSLFAVRACLMMGYSKIVLAGCPMDTSGREKGLIKSYRNEPTWTPEATDHSVHIWKWRELVSLPQFSLVRSMSGNTRRLLRSPSVKWLNQM